MLLGFFFMHFGPFFPLVINFFFNLVIVYCLYKDLELIIYFNFLYGYHYRDIKKISQHRVNIRKIS